MTGQAASGLYAHAAGREEHGPSRPHGGSRRSGAHSALVAGLFVSGLWLWMQPQAGIVLWAHLAAGAVLTPLLGSWLVRHVPRGLAASERPSFTRLSWALLGLWAALLVSGLALAVPALLWFSGWIWFPAREASEALSFIHFWASWLAVAGLVLHLSMRHWNRPRP